MSMPGEGLFWRRLQGKAEAAVAEMPGVAGVAVMDIATGRSLSINGDEPFQAASTIKIFVLAQLLAMAEAGQVDLARPVSVDEAEIVLGSGVLAHLENRPAFTVRDLAILMVIASDNTATNLCIDLAGMEATNELIRRWGLARTVLGRKMMDAESARAGIENVSSPDDLVAALAALHAGKPSSWVSGESLRILAKPKFGFLNQALPDDLPVAHKPGYVEGAACDAGIVFLPSRPYIVAAMLKYAPLPDVDMHHALIGLFRLIHTEMAVLDASNWTGRLVAR